ncbi:sensor histidine kinase [Sporosarcina thermotolerans]|uniref:Signal transduction histidine-protein kinase/phosphatase DegS n=2 Tax=Sporosarcina thermotolerans TaxID=633404 RepID=A0AAW9AAB8_9BACL|nr:sensor histidine kinase [Sporosarcina thermotolerans]MDW0116905.1 sensor histidine kinase [Sporosarcina thermotolerans]WHT47972.1 sensor histidine kinase [Sporosarcina thermotolerans]
MAENTMDIQRLESIFDNMVNVMDKSKNDIFSISEQSRLTFQEMQTEIALIKEEISRVIDEGDNLEDLTRHSRRRLADVSKNFMNYSEEEVRKAYETANDLLVRLSINRMEEKQLRARRDDLDRRIAALLETIDKADHLINQVTTVISYLTSDLKKVGEALETARKKQEFAVQIIQAQEEERKRLSRDIHDGPAQMLANVLLRSGLIEKTFTERGPNEAISELHSLKEMVRNALLEVRRIIYDLRPMALDDLGLIPTLRKYSQTTMEYEKGTTIHFVNNGSERRLEPNFEVSTFRLVQECITNALKHGKSRDVWVKVEWLRDTMNIVVKDNGKGFDVNQSKEKSFGIIGMRERIELLKGEMKIISSVGNGTTVLFRIPLQENIIVEKGIGRE